MENDFLAAWRRGVRREIFGPVIPITVVDSEEEEAALALTNSAQALVSAGYTGDVDRGFAFGERVRCGLVQVRTTWRSSPSAGSSEYSGRR